MRFSSRGQGLQYILERFAVAALDHSVSCLGSVRCRSVVRQPLDGSGRQSHLNASRQYVGILRILFWHHQLSDLISGPSLVHLKQCFVLHCSVLNKMQQTPVHRCQSRPFPYNGRWQLRVLLFATNFLCSSLRETTSCSSLS